MTEKIDIQELRCQRQCTVCLTMCENAPEVYSNGRFIYPPDSTFATRRPVCSECLLKNPAIQGYLILEDKVEEPEPIECYCVSAYDENGVGFSTMRRTRGYADQAALTCFSDNGNYSVDIHSRLADGSWQLCSHLMGRKDRFRVTVYGKTGVLNTVRFFPALDGAIQSAAALAIQPPHLKVSWRALIHECVEGEGPTWKQILELKP